MLNAVLSGEVGDDILANVMRPWLLMRAKEMAQGCPQQVLAELKQRYETFKGQCPDGRTSSAAFANVVLSSYPQVRLVCGQIAQTVTPGR
jgi:hypothetical protein